MAYLYHRAVATSPATGPVLTGPLFVNVKTKFYFTKKQVINKSTRVIFGLVRLFTLQDSIDTLRGGKLSVAYICNQFIFMHTRYSILYKIK